MKKTIYVLIAAALTVCIAVMLITGNGRGAGRESTQIAGKEEETAQTTPAPMPEPTDEERAQSILDGMSREEKVWQMLYVFPQDITGSNTGAELETWADALHEKPAGGFVVNSENMESAEQLKKMLSCMENASDIGAFIGIDEEGGQVSRLAYTLGVTTDFKPMYTYKEAGAATARENALTIAGDIKSFGFNQDFAPVADVWTNSENTVIGKRAYSDDPDEAAELVSAAVGGFSDGGVISTLKHFPGHGDTAQDSHYAVSHSAKTLEQLRECELKPFRAGIEAGAGMVMTGHITMDAIDPAVPATLSKAVVTDILRGELGYCGVVITDSFRMAAITEQYDECDAAVAAIEAGCDMILGPYDPAAVAQAFLERLTPERIDESVLRILTLKVRSGLAQAAE